MKWRKTKDRLNLIEKRLDVLECNHESIFIEQIHYATSTRVYGKKCIKCDAFLGPVTYEEYLQGKIEELEELLASFHRKQRVYEENQYTKGMEDG